MAVGIISDGAVFQFGNELLFVLVPFFGEIGQGIRLGYLYAAEIFLAAGQLQHLGFDGLEIGVRERTAVHIDIVVETILDGGADTELHPREQGLEGFGHEVGRAVPEHFLGFVIFPFEEADFAVFGDGTGDVDGGSTGSFGFIGPLDIHGQHLLGQSGTDGHGNVITGDASFELTYASIGELDVNHNL